MENNPIMNYIDEEKFYKIYKSHKTILEKLEDEGYDNVNKEKLTFEEFYNKYYNDSLDERQFKKSLTLTFLKNKNKIRVYWYEEPKLGTEFRNIVQELKDDDIQRSIIIIEVSVTPHAKQTLKELRINGIYIDVFLINELQVNISHNYLVPKHIICSQEEKLSVMRTYKVDRSQLMGIKASDPMAKYIGALKGQLVKIIRDSDIMEGEKTIAYRLVV
jgi:DNA-directed RNA polymerase subunit H (RpoH/RPB5)